MLLRKRSANNPLDFRFDSSLAIVRVTGRVGQLLVQAHRMIRRRQPRTLSAQSELKAAPRILNKSATQSSRIVRRG